MGPPTSDAISEKGTSIAQSPPYSLPKTFFSPKRMVRGETLPPKCVTAPGLKGMRMSICSLKAETLLVATRTRVELLPPRMRDMYSSVEKTWYPESFRTCVSRCSTVWIPCPAAPHNTMETSSLNLGIEPLCIPSAPLPWFLLSQIRPDLKKIHDVPSRDDPDQFPPLDHREAPL